ncbi:hypothetical protein ARMSODRAFT_1026740 [Armillaria solidipes]|uniref:Uncharacterized protein n=1 Tax=Armillaria solidipes TaxID=1076256 RepID=A0A2H3AN03_9AGAR|nr:hypothetical protein ARMSODRAFT_1026740 [Armillaria solidipes]
MHTPHRLTIGMNAQSLVDTSEELNFVSSHELTTYSHYLHNSMLILVCKEFSEFLVHRASRDFQFPKILMASCSYNYLIAMPENKFEYLRGIQSSSRLEFCPQITPESICFPRFSVYFRLSLIAEVAVIKRESKRLLTDLPQSVTFNIASSKRSLSEKSEHDQLNQNIRLINSPNDVPGDTFTIHITVCRIIPYRNIEVDLLSCSTDWAPTVPVQTKVIGHKRGSTGASKGELKDTNTLRQDGRLDSISRVNASMVVSMKRRNDESHHQYRSRFGNGSHEPAAHADSQLRRMQPWASSTRISPEPNLGACSYGNHFEFAIIVDSGHSSTHSLTVPDRAPKLDFNLILDPSMNEKSVHDGIPECGEPCPLYMEDVG